MVAKDRKEFANLLVHLYVPASCVCVTQLCVLAVMKGKPQPKQPCMLCCLQDRRGEACRHVTQGTLRVT